MEQTLLKGEVVLEDHTKDGEVKKTSQWLEEGGRVEEKVRRNRSRNKTI
jgi:hypothetical protein